MLLAILLSLGYVPGVAIPIHGIVMLVSHSSTIITLHRHIAFRSVATFIVASLPTVWLAPYLLAYIDRYFAQLIISLIILYVTWVPHQIRIKNPLKSMRSNMVAAGLVGGATALAIGVAGTFIAPFYLCEEWDNQTVVATKAACMSYLQLLKILTFSVLGFKLYEHASLVLPMCLMVVMGNLAGIYFVGKLSIRNYRFLYKTVLTLAVIVLWADIVNEHYGFFKEHF